MPTGSSNQPQNTKETNTISVDKPTHLVIQRLQGITTLLLEDYGIKVFSEHQLEEAKAYLYSPANELWKLKKYTY